MNMITTILEPFTPLQGISRKVASWNFLEYFRVWWAFVNKILRGCCITISWSIYRFWSTYLNIRENCITWTVRTSSILTIQFSLSRNSQTVFWNKLITSIWHHKLNITVSNFYVMITFYVQNVHRSPIHKSLVDGHLGSLSLHAAISMDFWSMADQIRCSASFNSGNRFGFGCSL